MFQVEIEDNGLQQRLEGIALRASKIPPQVWNAIGNELIASRVQTFNQGGRPSPWPISRAAQEQGRQTMIASGALRDSGEITQQTEDSVEVSFGEGLVYSIFHQRGTGPHAVTPRQRGYFWYKFFETGQTSWKAMALTKILKGLPVRRHVQIQDESRDSIIGMLQQYLIRGSERFSTTVG